MVQLQLLTLSEPCVCRRAERWPPPTPRWGTFQHWRLRSRRSEALQEKNLFFLTVLRDVWSGLTHWHHVFSSPPSVTTGSDRYVSVNRGDDASLVSLSNSWVKARTLSLKDRSSRGVLDLRFIVSKLTEVRVLLLWFTFTFLSNQT